MEQPANPPGGQAQGAAQQPGGQQLRQRRGGGGGRNNNNNNNNNGGGNGNNDDRNAARELERARQRLLDQQQMGEMFMMFPHESAIVMLRGIELGIFCSCALIAHCILITIRHWESEVGLDTYLRYGVIARIICALPRPYYWLQSRAEYVEARYQSTPQQVAFRLNYVYSKPSKFEKQLFAFYYAWLIATIFITLTHPTQPVSGYATALWRHCLLNVMSLVLHRLACVCMFYWLMNMEFKRGIPKDVVEKFSQKITWSQAMRKTDKFLCHYNMEDDQNLGADCAVCYGGFEEKEVVRKLQCGHLFHAHCVDEWLSNHTNKCPLCQLFVGPHYSDWDPELIAEMDAQIAAGGAANGANAGNAGNGGNANAGGNAQNAGNRGGGNNAGGGNGNANNNPGGRNNPHGGGRGANNNNANGQGAGNNANNAAEAVDGEMMNRMQAMGGEIQDVFQGAIDGAIDWMQDQVFGPEEEVEFDEGDFVEEVGGEGNNN